MADTIYFRSSAELRKWLAANHDQVTEVLVGYYKKGSGKPSITYQESVDQALCFGWIDGVRRGVDAERYTTRFTPRKPTSIWSNINVKRVAELTKLGLMTPPGLKAFQAKDDRRTGVFSFEQVTPQGLADMYEKTLKANKKAWDFFQAQPLRYRRVASFWVMSAKQEETRGRRLDKLITDSAVGKRLDALTSPSRRTQ